MDFAEKASRFVEAYEEQAPTLSLSQRQMMHLAYFVGIEGGRTDGSNVVRWHNPERPSVESRFEACLVTLKRAGFLVGQDEKMARTAFDTGYNDGIEDGKGIVVKILAEERSASRPSFPIPAP